MEMITSGNGDRRKSRISLGHLAQHPVDRSATHDEKGNENGKYRLPFPFAHLHNFAPAAMGAVKDLAAHELQEPFPGMEPVAAFYLGTAFGTGQRCQGAPQIQRSHIGHRSMGVELNEVLKMGMIGKKIEVFESPVAFLYGNVEITFRFPHCTLFHQHPPGRGLHLMECIQALRNDRSKNLHNAESGLWNRF